MNPFRGKERALPRDRGRFARERAQWPYLPNGDKYLYFIALLDAVKIGVTHSPAIRREDIRRATWREPEILAALPGPARLVETAIHKELAAAALCREWFAISHPAIVRAVELAQSCSDSVQLLRLLQAERFALSAA